MKLKKEAKECLLKGIQKVSTAVSATLGPKGRLAIINRGYGSPEITKDGVTVAKEIHLEDPWENMGAELIKQAAIKTNDIAGDCTTTCTLLTSTLCTNAFKAIEENKLDPVNLKKVIESDVASVIKYLDSVATPVADDIEKIKAVASISANNDTHIGGLIATAYESVGKLGKIVMQPSSNDVSYTDVTEGMEFPSGFVSPFLITNAERQEIEFINPLVLLAEREISDIQSIQQVVNYAAANDRPIVVIAEDFEPTALSIIIRNKINNGIKIAVMKMPGFGDFKKEGFHDLSLFLGANLITADLGRSLDNLEPSDLGTCYRFIMSKSKTLFSGGAGDKQALAEHYANIKKQIPQESVYNEGKFQERLKRLSGKVATVYVGAVTESELKEKMYRVEDAINAVEAAVAEGVISGGGIALVNAAINLDLNEIVATSLNSPFNKILENAGVSNDSLTQSEIKQGIGYDVNTMTKGNMWELGILDTVKGLKIALETASSITCNLLMSEVLIDASKRNTSEILPNR